MDTGSRVNDLNTGLCSRDAVGREGPRQSLVTIRFPKTHPLIELLRHRSHLVRGEVAKVLGEIADATAAPALVSALNDQDLDVRWLACVGLIAIGRDALAPLLEELAKRSDSGSLRQGARHVLYNLSDKATRGMMVPVLRALEGKEPEIGVIEPALKAADRLKRWKEKTEGGNGKRT